MIKHMTEKEKMLAGEIYSAVDPEVLKELTVTRDKIFENSLSEGEIKTKMLYKGSLAHYLMVVSETNTVINKLHTIITRN